MGISPAPDVMAVSFSSSTPPLVSISGTGTGTAATIEAAISAMIKMHLCMFSRAMTVGLRVRKYVDRSMVGSTLASSSCCLNVTDQPCLRDFIVSCKTRDHESGFTG